MTKTDELKTKRERIIHNEREKFRASLSVQRAIAEAQRLAREWKPKK